MDRVQVDLRSNGSSDELFDEYMRLSAIQCIADEFVADLRSVRQDAMSIQEKAAVDQVLERAWEQYQVLCAYVQVVYSAYIFELHGTESYFLSSETGFVAGDRSKFTQ